MATTKDEATEDKTKSEESKVETPKGEDEQQIRDAVKGPEEEESKEDEQTKESSKEEEESEGQKSEEKQPTPKEGETEAEFKKRFTQFKGDTPEEYLKQLEEAYANSQREQQVISKQTRETKAQLDQVLSEVAKDPELAKRLNQMYDSASDKSTEGKEETKTSPMAHPLLGELENEWKKKSQTAVAAFEEAHPDFASDDDVRKEVQDQVADLADMHYRKTGRMLPMDIALRTAWQLTGRELNESESVAAKTKEAASQSGSSKPRKEKSAEPEFTKDQIQMAEKLGVSIEDLRKYNK